MGIAWQDVLLHVDLNAVSKELLAAIAGGKSSAQKTLAMSLNQVIVMVATGAFWAKPCHMHPSDAEMSLLQGRFAFKLHTSPSLYVLDPGQTFFVPKWHPHAEETYGVNPAVFLVKWSPIPEHKSELTIYVSEKECDVNHLPAPRLPDLKQIQNTLMRPILPEEWSATVLLHPFSPRQSQYIEKDMMFTQLVIATLTYSSKQNLFYVNVQGCSEGTWHYKMDHKHTYIKDGENWLKVDMGWDFPSRDWLGQNSTYVGNSPLNWMKEDEDMAWWKQRHNNSSNWFWFNKNGAPFRIMFGVPPPSISKGNRSNLAFFQMFSFSYIVNFEPVFMEREDIFKNQATFDIAGLKCGNPYSFQVFNWPSHFTMSAMMVPVDFKSNPLPTNVCYRWDDTWNMKRQGRLQTTNMYYTYNANQGLVSTAALFGGWSDEHNRPDGYLLDSDTNAWTHRCERLMVDGMPIGQEPPWWPRLGKAQIMAVIHKPRNSPPNWVSPLTGTNRTVAILGVLFPPHPPQYPDSTYLWTWYDYTEYSEEKGPARPITFMQSASTLGEGTSLALADYFDYFQLEEDVHIHTRYLENTLKQTCTTIFQEPGFWKEIGGRYRPQPAAFLPNLKPWHTKDDIKDYPDDF